MGNGVDEGGLRGNQQRIAQECGATVVRATQSAIQTFMHVQQSPLRVTIGDHALKLEGRVPPTRRKRQAADLGQIR
jgi:hypothetical protein